ncbi:glycosyltransferase family 2 protein [Flavobacterium franklandianum]|uniref:Glycosyltransferase family 2 protein n=1 Tax=Flavobacterium franklandianum TaxID=2594430 RepID=A0A553C7W7_9FLAO|nr:glycosyltransferase family 2 protein [Flavobacterium franklandianum]TRX16614.1 glycosyltransferase family 2 protein [Flavobacterium franklandianum]TRX24635.1 glycosyltransferase family 2 protein [Flavobacterium franklandianum]
MSSLTTLLSIVIPVYNEEGNVGLLTESIENGLKGYKYEIIYIDDFSSDNTRKEIKDLNNPNVVLIELKRNYGQSSALAAGIDYAKGDYIVTMDGDMQNDPSDIPEMLALAIKEDWDLVTGIRQKRKDSFVRTLPSKIANYIIRKSTKLHITDAGCALKVMTAETAKNLPLYGELHRFIALNAHIDGARITEIPVKHHARHLGVSKYGLGRTFKVINDLLLILFQRKYLQNPLYLFGNLGMTFFGIGVIINLYLLVVKLMGNDIGTRPLLILGILLILVGIQFFTIGIVTDLLMRTYYESQNKTPYKIRHIRTYTNENK